MQVHAINIKNNSLTFGKIYKDAEARYSDKQETIISNITKTMRQPLPQFNGQAAEDYYKSEKNYDFIVEPDANDTVSLRGYKNMRYKGIGVNKRILADEVVHIGQYDSSNLLNVDDIKNSLHEAKKSDALYTVLFLLLGLCISLIAFNEPLRKVFNKNKTPIETVDSIFSGTKSVFSDTISTAPKVLNSIKK